MAYRNNMLHVHCGDSSAAQLAALLPTRVAVAARQMTRASRLWDGFRQPTPATLLRLMGAEPDEPLPLLREAPSRYLAEFPSVWNGLTRLEEATLACVAVNGLDCWRGGVHLTSPGSVWRWTGETVTRNPGPVCPES